MKSNFAMFALLGWFTSAHAQPTNSFPLWPDGAPGALGKEDKDIPTLTPFWPDPAKATGAAMVICPGGGYGGLAPHEGQGYARFLNEHGVAGFVLKYRLWFRGYRHTCEDTAVPVENSLQFANALRKAGVPFDLHVYQKGAHGIGLGSRPYGGGDRHPWTCDCIFWLKEQGFWK